MEDIELLAKCLTYMEQHLRDDMKTIDIAKECACSKSTLEKMFNYVYHISVHDYIIRRRMMKAAKMLQKENASTSFALSTVTEKTRARFTKNLVIWRTSKKIITALIRKNGYRII